MLNNKKVIVVMPAYNAARTLAQTYREIPLDIVDEVLLVDDKSSDETVALAREIGLTVFLHEKNLGYGGNQKTCYREALKRGAEVIVMLHPDYQYSPKLVGSLAGMIASGEYDIALGSRILGVGARKGGMPLYKYVANRFLTLCKTFSWVTSCRNTTPAIAPLPELSSKICRWKKTPTTFFSIMKSSRKASTSIIGSVRCLARQGIFQRLPRSGSPAV